MIYLACPYRHEDLFVRKKRCAAAHFVAAHYFLKGQFVFSPLTHNELLIDIINDQVPGKQWLEFDLQILTHCKELHVLKMEGWETSYGVQKEIDFAKEKNIPIQFIDPPEEPLYLPWIRQFVN